MERIELCVKGLSVAILRILDEKYYKKR